LRLEGKINLRNFLEENIFLHMGENNFPLKIIFLFFFCQTT